MEKPASRSFPGGVKKQLLCFSIALLLCLLAYVYQSMSGTGTGRSLAATVPAPAIRGVVFNDANGNGRRDPGEAGIRSVTVDLYRNKDGKLVATVHTNANGEYSFSTTPNNDYQVKLDNATDYSTGPLKDSHLTTARSNGCKDQMSSDAVLPESNKPIDLGNYPQITVKSQASESNGVNFNVGFTSDKSTANDFSPASYACNDCQPCSDDDNPGPGTRDDITPTPAGVSPKPGSKPEHTPTPTSKKPAPMPAPKSPAVAPPIYPKLPATGSDPAGHLLP
jgi:hypothetical protein